MYFVSLWLNIVSRNDKPNVNITHCTTNKYFSFDSYYPGIYILTTYVFIILPASQIKLWRNSTSKANWAGGHVYSMHVQRRTTRGLDQKYYGRLNCHNKHHLAGKEKVGGWFPFFPISVHASVFGIRTEAFHLNFSLDILSFLHLCDQNHQLKSPVKITLDHTLSSGVRLGGDIKSKLDQLKLYCDKLWSELDATSY